MFLNLLVDAYNYKKDRSRNIFVYKVGAAVNNWGRRA